MRTELMSLLEHWGLREDWSPEARAAAALARKRNARFGKWTHYHGTEFKEDADAIVKNGLSPDIQFMATNIAGDAAAQGEHLVRVSSRAKRPFRVTVDPKRDWNEYESGYHTAVGHAVSRKLGLPRRRFPEVMDDLRARGHDMVEVRHADNPKEHWLLPLHPDAVHLHPERTRKPKAP